VTHVHMHSHTHSHTHSHSAGGMNSDDELLGGLDSDDDDDMAALMHGFVAPTVSVPHSHARSHAHPATTHTTRSPTKKNHTARSKTARR
jgi:hypothetical protein